MKYLASLKLTIACLLATILLVLFGTLEQARIGLYAAQEHYFYTFFVTWKGWPLFPGGYTLGILLLLNLICAHISRFKLSWKHLGITLLHFGLILFIVGELLTAFLSKESQVVLKVGEVTNYAESPRKLELVLADLNHPDNDELHTYKGKKQNLVLRRERTYLPFKLELTQFIHERYPGSAIPKHFSSRINIYDADGHYDRSAEIYMNHPLHFQGRTFYQASFGQNDTLSVLHMVENPSWPLPYLSSILVTVGLLIQFVTSLITYRGRSP